MNLTPALAQLPPTDNAWLGAWRSAQREPVFFSDDPHDWRMLEAAWMRN